MLGFFTRSPEVSELSIFLDDGANPFGASRTPDGELPFAMAGKDDPTESPG